MDGIEATEIIRFVMYFLLDWRIILFTVKYRQTVSSERLPIIALTAHVTSSDILFNPLFLLL